jgi:hypothetical protein
VEKFEDANDFGGVEACGVFVESFGFAKVGEDFAARAVIKLKSVSFVRVPRAMLPAIQAYTKNRGRRKR